ncbi:MAG: multicopper oxidase family protein [Candidatus Sericytochromatia bacterium]
MRKTFRVPSAALLCAVALSAPACSPPPTDPAPPPSVAASASEASEAGVLLSAPFTEPAVLRAARSEGRTVTVDLAARVGRLELDNGRQAEVLTYNGVYPGPTIDVQEGDRLVVRFKNELSEPTSVHWHGLKVPADQDDATETIAPGASRIYAFDVPAGSAGTYWYHPHLHGAVATQVARGLFGALRVRAAADPLPASVGDTVAVLSDLRVDAAGKAVGPVEAERASGFEGERILVNGRQAPVLTLRPGETRRLRIVNAAASRYYRVAVAGQKLTLVATDGGYIERPTPLDELLLAPGERAELLVRAPERGMLAINALPYDRGASSTPAPASSGGHGATASHRRVAQAAHNDHAQGSGASTGMPMASPMMEGHGGNAMMAGMTGTGGQPLMMIRAEGAPAADATLPATLASVPKLAAPRESTRTVTFSENHATSDFFVNGQKFDASRIDLTAKLGATEVWAIENTGHMDHPFHLHGFAFQVLDRNGVAEPYVAWKDTVNVKPKETVRFAVRYDQFPGLRVFHCHILDHEDLGMMGVFLVE